MMPLEGEVKVTKDERRLKERLTRDYSFEIPSKHGIDPGFSAVLFFLIYFLRHGAISADPDLEPHG